MDYLAVDFETADPEADSACAVGLILVRDGTVVERRSHLIRPPRRRFHYTGIHGITWLDVADAPPFGSLWPEIGDLFAGVDFLAAHNARFDRSVLEACCSGAGISFPSAPFLCTVKLARRLWSIYPTKLPDVCRRLDIPLVHHQAESDAFACAEIVRAALATDLGEQTVRRLLGPGR